MPRPRGLPGERAVRGGATAGGVIGHEGPRVEAVAELRAQHPANAVVELAHAEHPRGDLRGEAAKIDRRRHLEVEPRAE
jgi:hypothetical protein